MIDYLNSLPLAGLLIVISLGYILGNVPIRGITLGPAGATLFVALLLGATGLRERHLSAAQNDSFSIGVFGFMLFIYSVGFEAGPRFFASFRDRSAWKHAMVATVVNGAAVVTTLLAARSLEISAPEAAGAMAGALTSAATFAASLELTDQTTDISVAFALAYPIGLVGIVLIIQTFPRLLKHDLGTVAGDDDGIDVRPRRRVRYERGSPEVYRVVRVEHDSVIGKSLRELSIAQQTGCVLTWIRRGDVTLMSTANTQLQLNDHVAAIGRVDELRELETLVGREVFDGDLQRQLVAPRRVQVHNPKVIGRSLAELRLTDRYDCVITRIERGTLWIEPRADVILLRGDIVTTVGRGDHVAQMAQFLGRFRSRFQDTDIAIYTGGMFLGLLLSDLQINFRGIVLGPGIAGGLLFAGLILGWLSEIGVLRAHVPRQARQLVRDLGVMLFIGEIGLTASENLSQSSIQAVVPTLFLATVTMTASVLLALLVAIRVFKLDAVDAWGSVSGGLTSSAALHTVRRMTDSNAATVAYVTAYATSSILATIAGRVIMLYAGW